jgi:Lrp/AsnC family transcriptional regulator for asnA, asnC and gidA
MPARNTFDETDIAILEAVLDEGRKPFTRVADELGVSEATVRARVARLERLGVVRFVADVDPIALGRVFANIGIRVQGTHLQKAIEAVADLNETSYCMVTAGAYDIVAEVVCYDHDDLFRLIQQDLRAIPGVTAIETMVVLQVAKSVWRYPLSPRDSAPAATA